MAGSDTVPAARALATLDLLQQHPGLTAAQIGARLGVTDRAARRYVATLRQAEIPVVSTPGRYGGYRIGSGLRLPPTVFTPIEALGLVMAVLDGQHAAADPDDPVGAALGKLIRVLPEAVARPARIMQEHALTAPYRDSGRPDPEIAATLVAAVADRHRVDLDYRRSSGRRGQLTVDPWAVVVRHGLWYLLCFAHRPGAVRTLRIDRVMSAKRLAERFEAPADLDPVADLERHLGSGWSYRTHVTFHAPLVDVAPYVSPTAGELTASDEGTGCMLRGTTQNPAAYAAERLAVIPYAFTVNGGTELQDAVAALAARMTQAVATTVTTP